MSKKQIFTPNFLPYDGTKYALLSLSQQPNTHVKESTNILCENNHTQHNYRYRRTLSTFITLLQSTKYTKASFTQNTHLGYLSQNLPPMLTKFTQIHKSTLYYLTAHSFFPITNVFNTSTALRNTWKYCQSISPSNCLLNLLRQSGSCLWDISSCCPGAFPPC